MTSNLGYLAGDESMFIPSDTSDSSDFEWIAGGFPCRDMIRERLISDNLTSHEPTILPLDFQTSQANIKSEILDDQPQTSDPLGCPISIIPAGQSTTTSQPDNHLTPDSMTKPSDNPTETRKEVEREKSVDFPIFELSIPQTTTLPLRKPSQRRPLPLVTILN